MSFLVLACLPAASRAECPAGEERVADRVFAHPYGEPSAPCADREGQPRRSSETLKESDLRDDRDERRSLRVLSTAGMGAGSALAGTGATLLFATLALEEGSSLRGGTRALGIGLVAGGAALVLTGIILKTIDVFSAPSLTPDGRGAGVVIVGRF
jgi:hypothetical protein